MNYLDTKHAFLFLFPGTHTHSQAAITDALATESMSKPPVKVKAATLTTESISKPPVKAKAAEVKGSWFTLAAIGLGALVVGSLAMKS